MSLSSLVFLSHGIQLAFFFVLVGFVIVFMKLTVIEKRVKNLEDHSRKYVTYEDYMETFNNMFDERETESENQRATRTVAN